MIFYGLQGYGQFLQPYPAKFVEHIPEQVIFENEEDYNELLHNNKFDMTTLNNKIIVFNNDMPSDDELYNIETEEDLKNIYNENVLFEFEIDIRNIFDGDTMSRKIFKSNPDSFEIEAQTNGDAKWFALILTPYDENVENDNKNYILYFDSIGTWDENKVLILEKKVGIEQGEKILFKDFSFELREKLIYFGV